MKIPRNLKIKTVCDQWVSHVCEATMVSTIPAAVKSRSKVAPETGTPMPSASKKHHSPPVAVEARCVRLLAKADDPASLAPAIERRALVRAANEVLIEIAAAAVNASDVKAATGLMAYAVFPRTPVPRLRGRRDRWSVRLDRARGVRLVGRSRIRRDGTHATHLAVEADAVVEKPKNLSWDEAAGIGVPFVTAMEGFRRAGMPNKDETVLVMGVNGKVGRPRRRSRAGTARARSAWCAESEPYEGHANSRVDVIDASATDVATRVRELTDGRAPTSCSIPSAIPIFRRRTNRWHCGGGKS